MFAWLFSVAVLFSAPTQGYAQQPHNSTGTPSKSQTSIPTATPLPPPTIAPTPTLLSPTIFSYVEARDQIMINLYQRISPSVYTSPIGRGVWIGLPGLCRNKAVGQALSGMWTGISSRIIMLWRGGVKVTQRRQKGKK